MLGVLGNKLALVSRRTGAVTVVGYFKARYKSDVLVVITSLGMITFFIAQMISQFTGGATLVASITGMNHVTSLLIFGTVVILYTAVGGFSAVVITDTIQGIVMCIGTFLFIFFVLKTGGGLASIDAGLASNMANVYDELFSKYTPGALLSYWVLVGFGTLGLPQTAVRAMGFKDTKSMHKAMWIGVLTCSFCYYWNAFGRNMGQVLWWIQIIFQHLIILFHILYRKLCHRESQLFSLQLQWLP